MTSAAVSVEKLEQRIDGLGAKVRRATVHGDRVRVRALQEALAEIEEQAASVGLPVSSQRFGPLLPLHGQVYEGGARCPQSILIC